MKTPRLANILQTTKLIALSLIIGFSINMAYAAWVGPTQAPPGGNTSAPVDISATSQVKTGGLWVGSLGTTGGAAIGTTISSPQYCIGTSCITTWPSGGTSQWATNGANISYSAGNVGIGTAGPAAKLEVRGTANEYTALFQSSLTAGQAYGPQIRAGTNSSDQAFTVNDATNATAFFRVRGDGKVGIGTTGPSYPLNVVGANARNSPILGIEGTGAAGGNDNVDLGLLLNMTPYQGTQNLVNIKAAGTSVFAIKGNGNVGIGTTGPGYKLDVAGDINFTGTLRQNGTAFSAGSFLPLSGGTMSGAINMNWNTITNTGLIYGSASGGMLRVGDGGDSWYGMGQSTAAGGATAVGGYYPYAINMHTGLALSAHTAYGGIRFYNQPYPTAPMSATPAMQITNNNVSVANTLSVGGPIFTTGGVTAATGFAAYNGSSFQLNAYNNNGYFAMNNNSTYWGLMGNYATNDWRLGYGNTTSLVGWNLRWDNTGNTWSAGNLYAGGIVYSTSFRYPGDAYTIQDVNQFYCNNAASCHFNWSGSGVTYVGNPAGVSLGGALTVSSINGGGPITSANIGSQSVNYANSAGYSSGNPSFTSASFRSVWGGTAYVNASTWLESNWGTGVYMVYTGTWDWCTMTVFSSKALGVCTSGYGQFYDGYIYAVYKLYNY